MQADLTLDSQLKPILEGAEPSQQNSTWLNKLTEFLEYVDRADLETRKSREFHQKLWEENPVSSVGMGTVNITAALDDPSFRSWVAEESMRQMPENAEARMKQLQSFHKDLASWLKKYANRAARVKMYRAMAALYPLHFTTITYDLMCQRHSNTDPLTSTQN